MAVQLLPPLIVGSITECSHSVDFQNAQPEATVVIERNRNGISQEVGTIQATQSSGKVPLNQGENFQAKDLVKIYQKTPTQQGLKQPDDAAIEVQPSSSLNPPWSSPLYHCSQTLILAAMIPGTKVEILDGTVPIGPQKEASTTGEAVMDVTRAAGLPSPGSVLKVRQTCSNFVLETDLPPTLRSEVPDNVQTLDSPVVEDGLYECSRAITVKNLYPGATVTVRGLDRNWSVWFWFYGGSQQTSHCISLPTALVHDERVEVRQEVASECGKKPGVFSDKVAPWNDKNKLCQPTVDPIYCNTTPEINVSGLKPEAEVEIGVYVTSPTTDMKVYTTNVTVKNCKLSDPCDTDKVSITGVTLPECGFVMVRQGECNHWSDWSQPQTVNRLIDRNTAYQPDNTNNNVKIAMDLFDCQNVVPVTNIFPVAGRIHIILDGKQINTIPVTNDEMQIQVPNLHGNQVIVEHHVCGHIESDSRELKPHGPLSAGEIMEPLFDGDTYVTVKDVTAGAFVELWDQHSSVSLDWAYAPFKGSDRSTVVFSNFGRLKENQKLFIKLSHCGKNLPPSERTARVGPPPDLDVFLNNSTNTKIRDSIKWEDANGSQPWQAWSPAKKQELRDAFNQAWAGGTIIPFGFKPDNQERPNDTQKPNTSLSPNDAWSYFKASVAQSLSIEIGKQVQWSLNDFTGEQLTHLLDSSSMFKFTSSNVYNIVEETHGVIVPGTPAESYSFLKTNDLIGDSSKDTTLRILNWCRKNLDHYGHSFTTLEFFNTWGYRGYPLLTKVLQGTTDPDPKLGFSHWTYGCWGTSGLLCTLMRVINIPVKLIAQPVIEIWKDPHTGTEQQVPGFHAQPWFMADDLYLSHGDDPYSKMLKQGGLPPIPTSRLLIDKATFDARFGTGVDDLNKGFNIGRRGLELAIDYLPNYLLSLYCFDVWGSLSHADGEVFDLLSHAGYTVTDLENQNLWGRLDAKVTALCGCGHIPH